MTQTQKRKQKRNLQPQNLSNVNTEKPSGERLQKVLSRVGFGSRRTCDDLIAEGKVKVNGQQAELGCRVEVEVDAGMTAARVEVEVEREQRQQQMFEDSWLEVLGVADRRERERESEAVTSGGHSHS